MFEDLERIHRKKTTNLFASTAFLFYTFSLFLTTVWLLHISPMSALPDVSLTEATVEELRNASTSFGFTYGEKNTPFLDQLNLRFVLTSGIFNILFSVALLAIVELTRRENVGMGWQKSLASGFFMGALHLTFFLAFLVAVPEMNFVTPSGEIVPAEEGIMRVSLTFWSLLAVQSFVIGCITFIWSRPLVPIEHVSILLLHGDSNALRLNLDNWKQYSTWIVTLFGGTFVTAALLYIVRVRQAKIEFFVHGAILLGGGLAIILLFVFFKIWKIETLIVERRVDDNRLYPK